jgi:TP901 family phage tail tape measure protein
LAAERAVTVRIRAEIGRFRADMAAAAAAAENTARRTERAGATAQTGIGRLHQVANAHEKAWSQVSTGMIAGGVAIAGGLTLAIKAAMDWESAWTGVLKTVDGTDEELARVESGLRGLAKTLPSTHTEIAGVAEAAGQLGVARADVVGFTKTMIDLGESTNLTAEDAATNIAQISNVMGTMEREGTEGVSRFGAALVALGNDGASTEAEILSMAQRIAGAGATIGASESDVLALSNTLASMGVNAELGGGVTTRVLLKMYTAVQEGGETLESFAQTAGMSADQFAEAFRTSPVEALDAVNKGLSRVKDEGGNVVATMKDLGIKGTEETQVMLALAASGNLLSDSLELGNKAWSENTALVDEANKRYETSSSKIKIAMNGIKDSAIDAGAIFLPMVASVAEGITGLADSFGDLPDPIQKFLVVGGAVLGVAMLATGGLMKLAAGGMASVVAMRALAIDAPRAARGIGMVAKAAGAIAAVATIGVTIGAMIPTGVEAEATELAKALRGIGKGGEEAKTGIAGLDAMFTDKGGFMNGLDVKGLEDAFKILGNRDVGDNIDLILSKTLTLGIRGSSNIEFAKKNFEQLDAQLASMSSNGNAEGAAASYEHIAKSAKDAGVSQEILTEHFPQYTKALQESAVETDAAADSAKMLGTAMGVAFPVTKDMAEGLAEIGVSADGSITAIDKLLDTLWQLSDGTLNVRAANRAVEDTFRSMEETIKKNGKSLDIYTAKGSENQASLDSYIGTLKQRTTAIATAVDENGELVHSDEEVQGSMSKAYEGALKAHGAFGIYGDQADTLSRKLLGIPEDVNIKTWLEDFATDRANGITGAIEAIPGYTTVTVAVSEDGTVGSVQSKIDGVTGKTEYVFVSDDGTVSNVQQKIISVEGVERTVWVDDNGTVVGTQGDINGIKGKTVTIVADASTSAAEGQLNYLARPRSMTVNVGYNNPGTKIGFSSLIPKNAKGGRAPGLASGGRVPATGLGTDMVMGVNERGIPHVRVDDREWVVNRKSSDKHDSLLAMINRDDPRIDQMKSLVGLAGGGKVSEAAKKSEDARKNAVRAEKELQARLSESRRDLNVDLRRGEITDAFTSGSGMGQVDKLREASRSTDYSLGKRKGLARDAHALEKALGSLTKESGRLNTALEEAIDSADELRSVRDSISGGLRGEFSLSGYLDSNGETFKPLSAKGIINSAKGKANRIAGFGKKLDKLRSKGYSSAIIQEIAELGTDEGSRVADALLGGSKSEVSQLNKQYARLDYWSGQGGESVTKSMYKGGVDAAIGVVNGLESKTKDVESAFYKLGKDAEKAFKRSLGIRSPSKSAEGWMSDVVDGSVLGVDRNTGKLESAMHGLGLAGEAAFNMQPTTFSVPPSREVARYAAQPAGASLAIDYKQLAQAMAQVQVQANVKIGSKDIAQANVAGRKELRLPN